MNQYKVAVLLLLIAVAACSKEEEQELKAEAPAPFKAQVDTAKQVNGTIQDAAAQQRQSIDEQSQ
ncbi:MAG: hypothetical protein Q7U57_00810 [Methylovulum sp.]|nr:hypothetical protein [Methylovulum sp.]